MKPNEDSWWTWKVSKKQGSLNLLAFLKEACKEAPSVKALKRAIDAKHCTVNRQLETFSSRALQEGDTVSLRRSAFASSSPQTLSILFEDDSLLICNKGEGIVCEKAKVRPWIPHFKGEWELVHRLDKETTGALIIAKSSSVKKGMIEAFKKHKVEKIYLAIVDGIMKQSQGTIDNVLGTIAHHEGQKIQGVVKGPKGSRAITHWKCLEKGKKASLVWCAPQTGRTHQLRVHLSGVGHPILGDSQYGKHFCCPLVPSHHLLHAYQLIFTHPVTKKVLKITAPIPKDFRAVWKELCPEGKNF